MSDKPLMLGSSGAGAGGNGGDDTKKSPKTGPLALISKLKKAASKGDQKAIAELNRLKGIVARAAQQNAVLGAIDALDAVDHVEVMGALPDPTEDEILGSDEFLGLADDVERADYVARRMQRADSLTHKAVLLKGKDYAQKQVANWVRINPVSVNRGTIGNQVVLFAGGQQLDVVRWNGDDSETLPVTITATPTEKIATSNGSSSAVRPFGILQFGTRGMMAKVEFDITTGVQFTVSGSSVVLQVGSDQPYTAPNGVKLVGMISFYPIAKANQAYRTKYLSLPDNGVPGANTAIIDVPAFASTLWVERTFDTTSTVFVEFLNEIQIPSYSYTIPPSAYQAPVPVPGDAAFVSITQTGAHGGAFGVPVRAIFGLSF